MNPLDDILPRFDFRERHSIDISAPDGRIMQAVTAWRSENDPLVRAAIRLRELPARLLGHRRQRTLDLSDFTLLEQQGNSVLIYGLIGAFWQAGYGLCTVPSTDAFLAPRQDDVCKLALGFTIQPGPGRSHRLVTETRVFCVTDRARQRFMPYWYLIRPVSGLIRRRMLAAIRDQSETLRGP
ncbi:DUF2867 domain-containing protein [Acetobacter orleanensis]|uniref:DUF2867 domain-containing protein n=1 Tax=Acetobacter orleanensis TaxID=104099 RepID=A0A4Y3TJN4_9PROT|nr:DUF2867 domain-containing protein [Acetobacter orleanensis]KXV62000.1 hypothetical protein AD949_12085 [Acetobacter orleanensis]PCD80334.1 DUF2867 domain-containing protein [Acetobacter orleanensis]GAN68913.1 hypothetical protein Abol_024_052 [Acetobacter orleanensis JCM 7639]GBR30752.1 hypothetical protein AA0473_2350 [Acetobacter orleanensis NRIC 0473]GEB81679.1 hypothetical protein AOR01nite_01560 [Acetobacter orleanensis]